MADVIVGHIGMTKTVHRYLMRQTDLLADLLMGLIGAGADTAAEGEVGRTADVLMFPTDGIVLFLNDPFG